jgi:hypothetical protein
MRVRWSAAEATRPHSRDRFVTDERQWRAGVHGGQRRVVEATINIKMDEA